MREITFADCKGKQKKKKYKKCDACGERFKCWTAGYPTDTSYVVDDVSLVLGNGDVLVHKSLAPINVQSGDTLTIEFRIVFENGEWREVK